MSPVHKLCLTALLGAVFLGYIYIDRKAQIEALQASAEELIKAHLELSKEETARLKLILDKVSTGGQKAAADLASSAEDNPAAGQQSSPRAAAALRIEDASYRVLALDMQTEGAAAAVLKDLASGEVFRAVYHLESEHAADDAEILCRLSQSLIEGSALNLTVLKRSRAGDAKVFKAQIIDLAGGAEQQLI